MAEQEKPFNIHDYIDIAMRRKWYLVIPLALSVLVSYGVCKYLPKVYKATTTILVQSQRVPTEYVRPTITDPITSRLTTISQEILSRTRLERVIQELDLFPDLRHKRPMEEVIEVMRKAIEINVLSKSPNERGQNSFTISYEGKEPRTVMMVTNKLASLFIEENLKVRESQAEGTSEFLSKELAAMEDQLKRKEHQIREYRERNMGQLPQQLDANLRILERLQQQVQTASESVRAAEDRSIIIQNQMEYLKKREGPPPRQPSASVVVSSDGTVEEKLPEDPLVTQLNFLKRELSAAQTKYTENHPDIIDLKKKIANLEPRVKEIILKQEAEALERAKRRVKRENGKVVSPELPSADPVTERLFAQYTEQYNEIQLEAKRLRGEIKNLKEQIVLYQKRVEDTPRKEQELVLLTRDYELMKANYQSILDKKMQAQMAENLERKQQGEQFKILDPARVPEKPIRPDPYRVMLIGCFLGLATGVALTWFRESLDQSFHTVNEVEGYLGIPVIATIPNLREERKAA